MSTRRQQPREQSARNTPGAYNGSFSFVNKDAGNLSSKDHNATVLWHVQHRYEKWKRESRVMSEPPFAAEAYMTVSSKEQS